MSSKVATYRRLDEPLVEKVTSLTRRWLTDVLSIVIRAVRGGTTAVKLGRVQARSQA